MTRQKSFKRLVRARMEKTGESYSAARAALLAADETKATEGPTLTMSDEAIRRRTGRGWEEWFDLLDEWGGTERRTRSGALAAGRAWHRRLELPGGSSSPTSAPAACAPSVSTRTASP